MYRKSLVWRPKRPVLGLTICWVFWAKFKLVFFMFFPKTLPYLYDSDLFWFISLYLHLCMTSLDNNIGFIFINNMFLMGFNPRILVLNQNLFRPNHDIKVIIKVNECQNIDPCMMSNMFVSLVWSYMVWVGIHVARFRFECSSCFFFFVSLIHFDQEILNFLVFFVFNLFLFFFFKSNPNLWFSLWSNQGF